jgi:predicted translin family RNA/ssDNA-binding protein
MVLPATQHRRTTMNKNPFEIRAEILQLAKDYMDQSYKMNLAFMQKSMEEGKKTFEDYQEAVKMYTTEDLMKKAQEMYSFVSKKD